MLLNYIRHALARLSAFFDATFAKKLSELFEIRCLLESRNPSSHFAVIFREREWQVSEIPQQLAALAFVCAVVVAVEEDGDVHDGGVEGGAAVVSKEGVAGGEEFVHVVDGADVDEVLILGVCGDVASGELRVEAEEDDPAAAEFFAQGAEQSVVVRRVIAFFNRAVRRLAAAAERRAVHEDACVRREAVLLADAAPLRVAAADEDIASRRAATECRAGVDHAGRERAVIPVGVREHEVDHGGVVAADELGDARERGAAIEAGRLESELRMPGLEVELAFALADFELLATVVHPDSGRREFSCPIPERVVHFADALRKRLRHVVDEPDEVIALAAPQEFERDVFRVAGEACRAFDGREDDLAALDGTEPPEIEREALDGGFELALPEIERIARHGHAPS